MFATEISAYEQMLFFHTNTTPKIAQHVKLNGTTKRFDIVALAIQNCIKASKRREAIAVVITRTRSTSKSRHLATSLTQEQSYSWTNPGYEQTTTTM